MPRKPRSGLSKASSRRPDGENETELLHVDEDVLGIGFQRTRPEFFNPMWQLSHPRSSEGDLDGADGQDLDFPPSTGVSLQRVDPSEVAASLMRKAGFRLADDKDVEEKEEEEEQVDLKDPGELPSLHLEVPDSPEAPSATPSPTPFAPVPEAPDSAGAWQPLEILRTTALSFGRFHALQQQESTKAVEDDVKSMMSGDDVIEALAPAEVKDAPPEPPDAMVEEASQALREMMYQREEPEDVVQQRLQEANYKDRLQKVQRGVKSYLKLQNFNHAMWAETFGYGKQERQFPDFWEQQEQRIKEAIDNWPLNPARLEEMQKSNEVQDWVFVMLKILGIDEDEGDGGGKATPSRGRRRRWGGHLQVNATFTKGGVELFYIDMSKGPFCVFPEKAVVMEIWRQQRLVQVSAALIVNDWKEPRAGAFGRMLPTPDAEGTRLIPATPQKGDGVAFPSCQHFQRNFQDFIDGSILPPDAT